MQNYKDLEIYPVKGRVSRGDSTVADRRPASDWVYQLTRKLTQAKDARGKTESAFTPLEAESPKETLRSPAGDLPLMGFTLIELMLVVMIIGALVAMVMPRLVGRGEQARMTTAKTDIQANIGTALKLYELDNGNFPSADEGLEALMSRPSSATNWNGPYLEKKSIDPWGREYKYKSPGNHRPDYDLYSLGKDGQEGTADDVKNWE